MKLLLVGCLLGLSACAMFERDPRTGYADEGVSAQIEDLYLERRMLQVSDAKEELGISGKVYSDEQKQAIDDRIRLKRLESKIASKREKKQYFSVRSALRSDRERIAFLSIPSVEARDRFASNRGLLVQDDVSPEIAGVIEANDITLGMSQKAVMESWGDPDAVEVAGSQIYGYERWRYNRYVSGNDGYQKENRVVYFEGGRVVGWERN